MHLSIESILSWVGGIGLGFAAIAGLTIFTAKQLIKTTINKNKELLLQDYKHQLDRYMREAEHDFQRKIHDFSLFSTKRHEKYSELHKLIHIAYSAVLTKINITPIDVFLMAEGRSIGSLQSYLRVHGISEDEVTKFVLYNDGFEKQKDVAFKMVKMKYEEIAEIEIKVAGQYMLQNELYLSPKVESLSYALFRKLDIYSKRNDKSIEEQQVMRSHLDELKFQMRKEMSVGYYKEQSPSN